MRVECFEVAPRLMVGSCNVPALGQEVVKVSNGSAVLSPVSKVSFDLKEGALGVGGNSQGGGVNEANAKSVLADLKRLPKSENTFQERLACLLADPSLETWQAFTYPSNEELVAQKASGDVGFREFLRGGGVWLPEVENVNHNIINNLLVRAADKYAESFVDLMLGDGKVEVSDLVIARGAPGVGKSHYLANQYALAVDDAKAMIQHRIQGLTSAQVHLQGKIIIQRFEHALMERFSLVLTLDALYLTMDAVKNKLDAMIESGKDQKVSVRDIQVDLITLCCRVLKRSVFQPRLTFAAVSDYAKSSLQNRQAFIELLEQKQALVKDYSLLVWEAGKYIEAARFCPEEGRVVAVDDALFDKCKSFEGVDAEIEEVRRMVIDELFMKTVVKDLDNVEAQRFVKALKVYEGRTLEEAMFIHSRDTSLEGA